MTTPSVQINPSNLEVGAIHLNQEIQGHGILFVLSEPDLKVLQVSQNIKSLLNIEPREAIGQELNQLIDDFIVEEIKSHLGQDGFDIVNPTKIWLRQSGDDYLVFDGILHRNSEGFLILELEPALAQESIPFLSFYHLARASINKLESTETLTEFCEIIVKEVKKVTGFDRVMLYKFDDDGHGCVLAEEKAEEMESFLGLHYPESDIPKVARNLFKSNWIRLIPNTHAANIDIFPATNPVTNKPVDLTNSILRSASSCHIEYLHNMGVGASLTISLIKDQKLWGLIACHHRTPQYVAYELRKACEFLGNVIFAEISSQEEVASYDYRMRLAYIQSALVDYMSEADNFIDGLVKHQPNILDLTSATGAAICFGGTYTLVGKTPNEEELNFLVQWLKNLGEREVFYTDSLPQIYPDAQSYKNVASGLLAIPISQRNYVLWFRPEVIQTVDWGGDPNQPYLVSESEGKVKLCPRQSFEKWKKTVSLTSLPWQPVEIKAALELRKGLVNIVLKQADELAQLAEDLERSNAELKKFAYVASHDLQEPLNQVANYVQLLEMRYQEALDGDAKEFITYVVEGVSLMQNLIDDVLAYSKVDLQAIAFQLTDADTALERSLASLRRRIAETGATITRDSLPTVLADSTKLMQLFQNLIGNAIKFRSSEPPNIHISATRLENEWLFSVKDNCIGIDPQFHERIFIIFQRLHTRDEYPGTGMGLAICKKIIECHRGRIWVESELGQGATFHFTIPVGKLENESRNGRKAQNNLLSRGQ
jgi:two-component system, chemotaxis family, sensor kinase Cph1